MTIEFSKILFVVAFAITAGAAPVYADIPKCPSADERCQPARQLQYVPLEPLSPSSATSPNLSSYLKTAYSLLLTLGALFAVATFTVGGVVYMTADAAGAKSGAVERMKASLWGLLLLLASALILYTVNPCLLSFNLGTLGTNAACPTWVLSSAPDGTDGVVSTAQPNVPPPPPPGTETNAYSQSTFWSCVVNGSPIEQVAVNSITQAQQNSFISNCTNENGYVLISS